MNTVHDLKKNASVASRFIASAERDSYTAPADLRIGAFFVAVGMK